MDPALQSLIDRLNRLSEQFEELREGVRKALNVATVDPEMALIRSRKVLEYVVRDVFVRRVGEPPGTRPLENLIQRLVKDGHFPTRLEAYTETIRKLGNVGAHHFGQRISASDVYQSLTQLMPILEWYFEVERPDAGVRLDLTHEVDATKAKPASRNGEQGSKAHAAIVPKGLRSFDANDSDFFLQLLPGPRDQSGLPESIRFWKYRIESTDEPSFTVGVFYGPSGGGKSSLVKAGLLPRLDQRVVTVYVEATSDDTEARLLKGLRRRLPDLPGELDLCQSLVALRQGEGLRTDEKVLLVLDQFEQWLHAQRADVSTELVAALRQCDGEHLQGIVMVRDDFWMAATRFMGALEMELVQGQNTAAVDHFDPRHARKVLSAFGIAYGNLPERTGDLTKDQHAFLERAITDLAQDGKVVPVRLALFAELMKGKPWTSATLREVGGMEGVGVTFLEETFSSPQANPKHRLHRKAAQAVLKSLLPETGTDIKGHMRSRQVLLEASGYANRPRDFDDLIRILDPELRLITPTEPEDSASEDQQTTASGQYYVLSHDYLVHSLRDWLTRKQRETRRGRAELRLAERSAAWNAKPENRHLPSALEWANIRLLTRKKDWTDPQRRMMRKVEGRNLFRVGLILFIGLAARLGIEGYRYFHAPALVEQLKTARGQYVESIIRELSLCRRWANPRLYRLLTETSTLSKEHLHASLALLPVDTGQVEYLYPRMLDTSRDELAVIMNALRPHKSQLISKLWSILESAQPGTMHLDSPSVPTPAPQLTPSPPPPPQSALPPHQVPDKGVPESLSGSASAAALAASAGASGAGFGGAVEAAAASGPIGQEDSLILRAATVLAHYDPESQRWERVTTRVSNELVKLNPLVLPYWLDALRPVKSKLKDSLVFASTDKKRPEIERIVADVIRGDYYGYVPFAMIGD
jgi:hypothetical protein